jgi:hypothetical protein
MIARELCHSERSEKPSHRLSGLHRNLGQLFLVAVPTSRLAQIPIS